ncbi:ead/Ea22-like family protein, partial [Escherichia coli]|nr:ead/Ea22-like family protein [Escherichia coli]
MSNIDKRVFREAAEKATPGNWWIDSHGQAMVSFTDNDVLEVFATNNKRAAVRHEDTGNLSRWRNDNDATFIATADPATVLALLDELEAKDSTIATQQQEIRTLLNALGQSSEKRNSDLPD